MIVVFVAKSVCQFRPQSPLMPAVKGYERDHHNDCKKYLHSEKLGATALQRNLCGA